MRPDLYCDGVVTYDFANDAASASLTLKEPDGSERAVSGSTLANDWAPHPVLRFFLEIYQCGNPIGAT